MCEFCTQLSMLFTILLHFSYYCWFEVWCFDKCQILVQSSTCHKLLYFLDVKSWNHYWIIQVWNHLHEFYTQLLILFTILSYFSHCCWFKIWCFDECQILIQSSTCHKLLYFLDVKSWNHHQINLWMMIFVYSSKSSWLQWNKSVLKFHFINCCSCFDFSAWR